MPDTNPTTAPVFETEPTWTTREIEEVCDAFRCALVDDKSAAADAESLRAEGADGQIVFYRATRSFRWTERGAPGGDPLSDLNAASALWKTLGEGAFARVLSASRLPMNDRERLTMIARGDLSRLDRRVTLNTAIRAGTDQAREEPVGLTGTVHFRCAQWPYWNTRLRADFTPERRVHAISLFWNKPATVASEVRLLSFEELDAALRCRGLGAARWAGRPVLGYRLGFPHHPQPLLVPLYRVGLRFRERHTFMTCTAFRVAESRLPRAAALDAFLGDVVAL